MADLVALGLRREGMAVAVAYDGLTGLAAALSGEYQVVVLDRDLPGRHGDDVCADLVGSAVALRILMLTAAGGMRETVDGLGLGADDYLAKPFDFPVLIARIRALARRDIRARPAQLEAAGIRLDVDRREAVREGRALDLRPKEFAVLEYLLAADGRVVSAEELLERVWDEYADPFSSAVKITVSRLRRKLGDPDPIETVAKAGYRI